MVVASPVASRQAPAHARNGLLRFLTCGSVDDGKSTLIGRLLFESKALFEAEDFDGVVAAAKKWGGIAALTRSAKGCVIVEEGMVHEIPAAPIARVVDTTGAGDQFAAGFLYGLTHGKGLADCGRLGALAAAEVISHYGARPEVSLKELAATAGLI